MIVGSYHFTSAIELVGALLGVIVVVASAVAVARVSMFKAQVEGLRGDRDDLKERVDRVEQELAAEKVRADTAEARVKVLEGVVTGRAELASISSLLANHDEKTTKMGKDILDAVKGRAAS